MFPLQTSVALRYPPVVTWLLIAANTAVFLFETSLPRAVLESFLQHHALVPARYFVPGWAELHGLDPGDLSPFLTNMFLHGGWFHLIANMWTLYIFGPAVEDRLGPGRYLLFYLVCGLGASWAHAAMNAGSTIPALGASGAIAGVLGAFMRLFPLARVIVMVPLLFIPYFFTLPGALFAGFWFALQLVQGLGSLLAGPTAGGVAWWAHVGGFVFGWLIVPLLYNRNRHARHRFPDEGVLGFPATRR